MSYINREETIRQIEEVQSLYTGQYFDLIGRALDVVKNMPDEPVEKVVRCNDCKFQGHFYECPFDADIECTRDDYCGRGVPRISK